MSSPETILPRIIPWKESDIVDKDLFGQVLQQLEAAQLTKEDFFRLGDALRVAFYDTYATENDSLPFLPLSLEYTQWRWMRDICEHMSVEWPGNAIEPDLFNNLTDDAFGARFRAKRKHQSEERERRLQAEGAKRLSAKATKRQNEQKSCSKRSKRRRTEDSQLKVVSFLSSITTKSTVETANDGEVCEEGLRVGESSQPAATEMQLELTVTAPMSEIWEYLLLDDPPTRPTYPGLPANAFAPFDIVFPAWRDWNSCWVEGREHFRADLNGAIHVQEFPVSRGYYKIVVSQRAGTRLARGNAKAVLDCWQGLRWWSEYLHTRDGEMPAHTFILTLYQNRTLPPAFWWQSG
ncbi:hypothetical protein PWT90_02839 [Aphanocladium album]|nr:hypothetical protein PWT90_02839 [Aphanocladium album]